MNFSVVENVVKKHFKILESGVKNPYGSFDNILIMGLPASGKTFLAQRLCVEYGQSLDYWNLHNKDRYYSLGHSTDNIFDGLFPTIESFLEKKKKERFFYGDGVNEKNTLVIFFQPDVEQCLKNDLLRGRENSAAHTIEKMAKEMVLPKNYAYLTLEIPKLESLGGELLISSWQEPSKEFEEFDDYLEKNFPKITFLQYKKICKLVEKQETRMYDYYDTEGTPKVRYYVNLDDVKAALGE